MTFPEADVHGGIKSTGIHAVATVFARRFRIIPKPAPLKVSLYSAEEHHNLNTIPVLPAPPSIEARPAAAPAMQARTGTAGSPDNASPAISWMLAIALAFLCTGLAGAGRPVVDIPSWITAPPPPPEESVSVEVLAMAEPADDPAPLEPATDTPPDALPPADASAAPPEPTKPILNEDDIVPIPEAPPIEPALRVEEPPPPARERRMAQSSPTARPAPAPQRPAAAAPGAQGTGGNGGSATTRGGGKGKFPQPPYPAFAKSRGLTGTVTLNIRVAPSGDVTSAAVSGSSGASELDNYAASWVSRRWKWPAGDARTFRLPVTFRLR